MSPDDHRPAVPDLYETDFYLWTQAQAEAIRAHGQAAPTANPPIDWDRVAEEIEDMGKSERREARSRTIVILQHLFKLAWSKRPEPRGGWEETIVTQRDDLKSTLTPTIRKSVEIELESLHLVAADAASRAFAADEPSAPRDVSLRWTLPQILGEENDPIA
ncbi:MAG: DUF29 domain-containing protein [Hyphomonadaceae bacterium]|nr:DUF29 domain-containing protein [Hyphomonadaceae bacterium]